MASLNLAGKNSGYVKITAPDDSSNNPVVTLPTESGELALKSDIGSGGGSGGGDYTPENLVWEDKTSERATDTVYTNTNDVPLYLRFNTSAVSPDEFVQVVINGVISGATGNGARAGQVNYNTVLDIVPAGQTYEVRATGTSRVSKWCEARMPVAVGTGEKPLNLSANRNLIINGDMRIAQRGTSASGLNNVNGYYTVDRWKWSKGGSPTFAITMSQDSDVPNGQGFSNSLKYQVTTAQPSLGSNVQLTVAQYNEGQNLQHLKFGTASAESLTLSFWVKSNKTGTYVIELGNYEKSRIINKSYTIDSADTWEKKTITMDGDTVEAITNDNGARLGLSFCFASGSDYTTGTLQPSWYTPNNSNRFVGQTNLADTVGNYINITGVQLEVGDKATPFEHQPYDVQLHRCQRYYEVSGNGTNFGSNLCVAQNTGRAPCACAFPVAKRATPTVSVYSADTKNSVVSPGEGLVTVTNNSHNQYGIQFLDSDGDFVANTPYLFYYTADAEL